MESREGMSSSLTMIAPEVPSPYHVDPRTENSILVTGAPPLAPSSVYAALTGSSEKKKRGRPRKYGSDGPIAGALSPVPASASVPPATGNFSAENASVLRPVSSEKKQKKNKQRMGTEKLGDWVACSTGINFLPHTLTVDTGEDVAMKVISFCQQGPRAICIISGAGLISNVTLRQGSSSGGTLTYEGRFEIISLSGSFTPTESGGSQSRNGGMTITLAGPDGRMLGGLVAGLLVAASPVKVVVSSFLPTNHHEVRPKKQKAEDKSITTATGYAAMPHTSNEGHISSSRQGLDGSVTANQAFAYASSFQTANGAPPMPMYDPRKSNTDINISLQRE